MKKRTLLLSWMLIAIVANLSAQDVYKGQIRISGLHFNQKSNMLEVEMAINYDSLQIDSNESLTITPYLQASNQRFDLASVLVNGKQEQKAYLRAAALAKDTPSAPNEKTADKPVVVFDPSDIKVNEFSYKTDVPFQEWMYNCSLFLEFRDCGCNGKTAQIYKDCLSHQPIIERLHSSITTPEFDRKLLMWIDLVPAPKTVEQDLNFTETISLNNANFFRGNSQRKINDEVYKRLSEAVRDIRQMNDVDITAIDVTGYGCPIGNSIKNERKALKRSLSLKDCLCDTGLAGKASLNVRWIAEDWDLITSLIQESDMMLKEAVLNLIQQIDVSWRREPMLRQLADGQPYEYLESTIYPQVRRVEYTIHFRRQEPDIEEIRLLMKNTPNILSLEEFFAMASTYPKGSTEFNIMYDLAAHLFPNSPEANINAGAVSIIKKDIQKAHKYLDRFSSLPQASFNMGLLYFLEGNREKAEVYLSLAKTNGVSQAVTVMEYLRENP